MASVRRHLEGAFDDLGQRLRELTREGGPSATDSLADRDVAAGIRGRLGLELAWAREVLQAPSARREARDPIVAAVRRFAGALRSIADALGDDGRVQDLGGFQDGLSALRDLERDVRVG
jgi:hypothetical protein